MNNIFGNYIRYATVRYLVQIKYPAYYLDIGTIPNIIIGIYTRYISVHFSVRIYRHMPDSYSVTGEHRNLSDNFIYTIYKVLYIVYIPAIIEILILIYMRIYININL